MSSNTLMETLKIEFTEIGDNYVVCKMPVTPEVHQPAGILHGEQLLHWLKLLEVLLLDIL